MEVRDIMTASPSCVTPDDPLSIAAQVMREMDVGIVPVIDNRTDMRLVGVVTDRDIAVRCVAQRHEPGCQVRDHMTSMPLHTVHPDASVEEVIAAMEWEQVRRIPVVLENGRLCGIIAVADVARQIGPSRPVEIERMIARVSEPADVLRETIPGQEWSTDSTGEEHTMKTDLQVQKDVIEELRWDPSIGDKEIGVAAKNGVVTLTGFVGNYAEKHTAEHAAERVIGVKAIADELKVRLPSAAARSDTDLAHAAVTALRWDVQVPNDRVTLTVDSGWITLAGSVEWKYQMEAAERAVRYLTGAKGISNTITIKPKSASRFEVSGKINDALRRSAEKDADRITVETSDGRVTLKGNVRSFADRLDAERAAWSAPGVTAVEDRLVVL